jgi:hypothetical protein
MKLLQIAFIAILGVVCMATFVTSETLCVTCEATEQSHGPAL